MYSICIVLLLYKCKYNCNLLYIILLYCWFYAIYGFIHVYIGVKLKFIRLIPSFS